MKLDDEDSGDGLKLVSGVHGMDGLSSCTIVIIAGQQVRVDRITVLSAWFIFLSNKLGQIYFPTFR